MVAPMRTVKFVHTADCQLGMKRHVLGARHSSFDDARMDSIRAIVARAEDEGADFILAAGDVFDDNSVATEYVIRALSVLGQTDIPVYILPGNHDLYATGSVYKSKTFDRYRPANVHVIASTEPVRVREGVEIVGLPVVSKYPLPADLGHLVGNFSTSGDEGVRILALHGGTDLVFSGSDSDDEDNGQFAVAELESLITSGTVHYVALGDRHSVTSLGDTERIWYPGAPEVTAFDDRETDSGQALLVELDGDNSSVRAFRTGTWKMLRIDVDIDSDGDVDLLKARLDDIEDKQRTIVKLTLHGTVSLELGNRLDEFIEDYAELFANVRVRKASTIVRRPALDDIAELFSGYARDAAEDLTEKSIAGGPDARTAENALALLYRLSRSEAEA